MTSAQILWQLFRMEWRKSNGNLLIVGTMIWIFPLIGLIVVLLTTLAAQGMQPEQLARLGVAANGQAAYWPDYFLFAWYVPSTAVGRWLLIAFTAVMFGGEYQWHTWKALVPRRSRIALILNKFLTLSILIVLAFAGMSLILGFGMMLPTRIAGGAYGPAISGPVLADFAADYAVRAITAFASAIIGVGYSAIAAMITRSILGSVMIGVGAFALETMAPTLFGMLGYLLNRPGAVILTQFTPGYNLQNILMWLQNGMGHTYPPLSDYATPNSLPLSCLILLIWIVSLIGLTTWLFQRQDITH
jgi:ABC-type transport system involved in multi-copper enzyme maturation permease subunit